MQIVLDAFETHAATCMAINTCIREILSHTTNYPENLDLQCQLSNKICEWRVRLGSLMLQPGGLVASAVD